MELCSVRDEVAKFRLVAAACRSVSGSRRRPPAAAAISEGATANSRAVAVRASQKVGKASLKQGLSYDNRLD